MELTPTTAAEWVSLGHRLLNRLAALPQPVVAAVHGYALGGGLELALACDFRLLADDAQLGLPEVTRGWTAGWGGPQRLQALVGPSRARDLALLGEPIDAVTAQAWGLGRRVDTPALADEARSLARRLAQWDVDAVRRTKAMLLTPALVIDEAAVRRDAQDPASFVRGPLFRTAIAEFLARQGSGAPTAKGEATP